jgi:hypothetical protein
VAPTLGVRHVRVKIRRKRRPVTTRKRRRRARTKVISYLVAVWASASPAQGQVFDVQRARPGGGWIPVRTGGRDTNARLRIARGSTWLVRARLRSAADASKATGWSPPAGIRG